MMSRIEEGVIVGSHAPDDTGNVVTTVRLEGVLVQVLTTPSGIGLVDDIHLERGAPAVRTVAQYWRSHAEERVKALREAATLRRLSGNPPPGGVTPPGDRFVVGPGARTSAGAMFSVQLSRTQLRVFIAEDGSVVDEADDWEGITDIDRDAAINLVLGHIEARPEEANALGVDVDLVKLLWR